MRRIGREPSALELMLWRHMVRDVQPLDPAKAAPDEPEPPPAASPADPAASTARKPARAPAGRADTPPSQPAPVRVDRRTLQRLQRGQYPITSRLDLHGLTQAEAHARLSRFVTAQHAKGSRCVLVITGRGLRSGGILRNEVPRWLASAGLAPLVLAVSPARIAHGGEGALYILLRRRRDS